MIEIIRVVPSNFFLTVNRTSVPFFPLINLIASSKRIPTISKGSLSACATSKITSPASSSPCFQAGPPETNSKISV